MAKFRKKPVVIEAIRFDGDGPSCDAVSAFIGDVSGRTVNWKRCTYDGGFISTLEGQMEFRVGDMIIRGVKGEFYPIKAEIFAETYEAVDDAAR